MGDAKAWDGPRRYRSDDRDMGEDHDLDLQVLPPDGNGDWYVSVLPHGHRFGRAVRVTTSGTPRGQHGVYTAVANLYRAMGGEEDAPIERICATVEAFHAWKVARDVAPAHPTASPRAPRVVAWTRERHEAAKEIWKDGDVADMLAEIERTWGEIERLNGIVEAAPVLTAERAREVAAALSDHVAADAPMSVDECARLRDRLFSTTRGDLGAGERDGATVHVAHPAMVMAAQAIDAARPAPAPATHPAIEAGWCDNCPHRDGATCPDPQCPKPKPDGEPAPMTREEAERRLRELGYSEATVNADLKHARELVSLSGPAGDILRAYVAWQDATPPEHRIDPVVCLTPEQMACVEDLCANPPEPTPALRALFAAPDPAAERGEDTAPKCAKCHDRGVIVPAAGGWSPNLRVCDCPAARALSAPARPRLSVWHYEAVLGQYTRRDERGAACAVVYRSARDERWEGQYLRPYALPVPVDEPSLDEAMAVCDRGLAEWADLEGEPARPGAEQERPADEDERTQAKRWTRMALGLSDAEYRELSDGTKDAWTTAVLPLVRESRAIERDLRKRLSEAITDRATEAEVGDATTSAPLTDDALLSVYTAAFRAAVTPCRESTPFHLAGLRAVVRAARPAPLTPREALKWFDLEYKAWQRDETDQRHVRDIAAGIARRASRGDIPAAARAPEPLPDVSPQDALTPGMRVVTAERLTGCDTYKEPFRSRRRAGVTGVVVREMREPPWSESPFYEVRHDDGTEAPYDRAELTIHSDTKGGA